MSMTAKNQKTKDLLEFINSEQLDNFSYAVFDLDQTLYDYETCNQNGVSSVLKYIDENFNIDKKTALNAQSKAFYKSTTQEYI